MKECRARKHFLSSAYGYSMDHIVKVSSFCLGHSSAPSLDVTRLDPQFGMNEEYDVDGVRN